MELRVLKYFLMVAREENITRAAQRLNVTQPTLSRQLMQMEEELGVKSVSYTHLDNVMYKFYGGSTKNGYVAHLLAMCACDKDFNGNINMYLNKMK